MRISVYPRQIILGLLSLCAWLAASNVSAATLLQSDVTTFYFGIETPLPDPGNRIVVDAQHTDFSIRLTGGVWDLHVHADEAGELEPQAALLYGNANAQITMPNLPFYNSFIGAAPGSSVWILPQTQDSNVLFLGFGAEEMTPTDLANLSTWNPGDSRGGADESALWLKVELIAVRGPAGGEFSMWANTGFGDPDVFFSTAQGGVNGSDVVHILAGGHSHYNWGFTMPGEYEVDIRVSTYIVPEPSTAMLLTLGLFIPISRSRRGGKRI